MRTPNQSHIELRNDIELKPGGLFCGELHASFKKDDDNQPGRKHTSGWDDHFQVWVLMMTIYIPNTRQKWSVCKVCNWWCGTLIAWIYYSPQDRTHSFCDMQQTTMDSPLTGGRITRWRANPRWRVDLDVFWNAGDKKNMQSHDFQNMLNDCHVANI